MQKQTYDEKLQFDKCAYDIEFIKLQTIGRRIQAVRGEYSCATQLDFVSMYPTVAIQELYLASETVPTLEYVPEKFVTSVDIECMLEGGVKFTVQEGIYWKDKTDYFSKYMTTLMIKRNEYKRSNNQPMNEHCKALASSLTGAIFQDLRREYTEMFNSKQEVKEYVKRMSKYVNLICVLEFSDSKFMTYFNPTKLTDTHDLKMQKMLCQGTLGCKPVLLTMFIYAYARVKLWRTWRYIEGSNIDTVVYCDTDSLAVVPRCGEDGMLST